jgi:hypothetical protein
LPVEFGEMRAASPGEGVPSLGEAAPQCLVGFAVYALDRLPLIQDGAQPVAAGFPLGGLGADLLGLLRQLLLPGGCSRSGLLSGRLRAGEAVLGASLQVVQQSGEPDEVAHGGRLDDVIAQGPNPGQRLFGVSYSRRQPGLEQFRFGEQVVEAAREVS